MIDEKKKNKKESYIDNQANNNMCIIEVHEKGDSNVKPKKLDFINDATLSTTATLKASHALDDSYSD